MRGAHFTIWMLLLTAPLLSAQKNAGKVGRQAAAPRVPPAATPRAPGRGGNGAGKMANPGNIAERLARMTPEQRERALEKLPPERQAQIRQRLERFDNLPEKERNRRLQLFDNFAGLTPDKQNLVRRQIQAFNGLPDDRRKALRGEMQRLQRMTESERQARLASEDFKNRYSPAEQQMMSDISENLTLPGR